MVEEMGRYSNDVRNRAFRKWEEKPPDRRKCGSTMDRPLTGLVGEGMLPALPVEKTCGACQRVAYLKGSMIPDISLGIVFSLVFFGLGIVAFAYLAKGKN
jgi:hypothetical protein